MYIHEKFQGFSSKNGLNIAIGFFKFGVRAAAAIVGEMSIT